MNPIFIMAAGYLMGMVSGLLVSLLVKVIRMDVYDEDSDFKAMEKDLDILHIKRMDKGAK